MGIVVAWGELLLCRRSRRVVVLAVMRRVTVLIVSHCLRAKISRVRRDAERTRLKNTLATCGLDLPGLPLSYRRGRSVAERGNREKNGQRTADKGQGQADLLEAWAGLMEIRSRQVSPHRDLEQWMRIPTFNDGSKGGNKSIQVQG